MSSFQGKWSFVKMLWILLSAVFPFLGAEVVTTVVDDSDPNIKAISGNWVHFTGDEYYNHTETLTREAGATSLYIFNGTGISVFGTQCDPPGGNTTVSTYILDNNGPSVYTVPAGVTCNQNFVNFFTSPPLTNGLHTLVIKNLNDGAWFFLDYLEVITPGSASNSTALPLGSPSTASSAGSSAAPSAASSASSTGSSSLPASGNTNTTPKSTNTGAIVGGAVGAAVVAIVLVLGFIMLLRRRRHSHCTHEADLLPTDSENGPPNPFSVAHRPFTFTVNPHPIPYPTSTFLNSGGHSGVTNNSRKMPMNAASPSDVPPGSTSEQTLNTDNTLPSEVSVVRRPTTSTMPPPY